ncbi:MAG TPA: M48 family metallopeptidase [Propioniciclava sp.]|jgi:predicted metal-dependent hydrolase|uniref:M48 family metallopeptidase n=1 Tax=Propioniciclava sp. TaxID=2038686 RepID=UPI002C2AEC9C|nr:M48 family metallopeptidase [Propioniciclava sp.]HRL50659.1 M48 family metallopeptidase [Propioniciclava sp.]HRL81300.1 M48 family metallopeptidase [Propioniciclava sp.]
MPTEGYEVRDSSRRTRTMTAFREEGRLVVVVPEHMTARQRRALIPGLVERYLTKEARQRPPRGDHEISSRARELYRSYIAPHTDQPEPVIGARWVSNMASRWASCTPSSGEIRVSDRLQTMPAWVLDYVLLHEVAHFVEREHNDRFWHLVNAHTESPRARGFLEGVDHVKRTAG